MNPVKYHESHELNIMTPMNPVDGVALAHLFLWAIVAGMFNEWGSTAVVGGVGSTCKNTNRQPIP